MGANSPIRILMTADTRKTPPLTSPVAAWKSPSKWFEHNRPELFKNRKLITTSEGEIGGRKSEKKVGSGNIHCPTRSPASNSLPVMWDPWKSAALFHR